MNSRPFPTLEIPIHELTTEKNTERGVSEIKLLGSTFAPQAIVQNKVLNRSDKVYICVCLYAHKTMYTHVLEMTGIFCTFKC